MTLQIPAFQLCWCPTMDLGGAGLIFPHAGPPNSSTMHLVAFTLDWNRISICSVWLDTGFSSPSVVMEHSFQVPKVIFISMTFSISLGCLAITHPTFTLPAWDIALCVTLAAVTVVCDTFLSAILLEQWSLSAYDPAPISRWVLSLGRAICLKKWEEIGWDTTYLNTRMLGFLFLLLTCAPPLEDWKLVSI